MKYLNLIPQVCDSIRKLLEWAPEKTEFINQVLFDTVIELMLSPFEIITWINYINMVNLK